jgi:hypothetical protein
MNLKEVAIAVGGAAYMVGSLLMFRRIGASDTVMKVAMVGSLIVAVGGGVTISDWLAKRRAAAMMRYAKENGLSSDPGTEAFMNQLASYALFSRGESRKVTNLSRGQSGALSFAICDYEYTVGGGRARSTKEYTVCVIELARLQVPHFFARRQHDIGDFLGKLFGGADIDFDDDHAFSKAIVLQTRSAEAETRRLFSPGVRAVFTALSKKSPEVEGLEDKLIFHYGQRLAVARLNELVDDALTVARSLG